jgi:hypothetical protein
MTLKPKENPVIFDRNPFVGLARLIALRQSKLPRLTGQAGLSAWCEEAKIQGM